MSQASTYHFRVSSLLLTDMSLQADVPPPNDTTLWTWQRRKPQAHMVYHNHAKKAEEEVCNLPVLKVYKC